ncbi:MAG TPA: DUF2905 domain-containing protein [bacterium]|nr:DUF2905 domain-containing protein [bacterium]
MTVPHLGRLLVGLGLLIAAAGAVVWLVGGIPRLPGDIIVQRRGWTLYIPIVTSIVLSLFLTLLLNLFFARR